MKGKHIVAMVAFILTFSLSILLVGFPKAEVKTKVYRIPDQPLREKMLRFLKQDQQNGREMLKALAESHESEAKIVEELLAKMDKMSAADLPSDFQKAWQNHIEAWRRREDLLNQTSDKSKSESTDKESNEKRRKQSRDINDTYNELLKIAKKHGVSFSYYSSD